MQLGTEKTAGLDDETTAMVQRDLIYLHLCGSDRLHAALGVLVVRDWTERQNVATVSKDRLLKITNSLKNFYLVPPFNKWYVTATGVPGVPADDQHGESYNNDLQRSAVIKKRQSKECLLTTGIPQMLIFDGGFFENVEMRLDPTGYASQFLCAAYTILSESKYQVRVPRGTLDKEATPYPKGTRIYFNAAGTHIS